MGVKKVTIIGMSESGNIDNASGEKWGLPWHEGEWVHYDRLFEMHDLKLLESEHSRRKADYIDRLKECEVPLYMQEQYFDNVTAYPFNESVTEYYNSSIAYMMALAITEEYEQIDIIGVDMTAYDEFGYQKPNMEYLIGLAEGKGIKVNVPDDSPLLKFNGDGIYFGSIQPTYKARYGHL